MPIHNIAVVGAGISGLITAHLLHKQGFKVQVFEESNGYGGRLSTWKSSEYTFDNGTPCFTAQERIFSEAVSEWITEGVVEQWNGKFAIVGDGQTIFETAESIRYVGTPNMSSIPRHIAGNRKVHFRTRIDRIERIKEKWRIISSHGFLPGFFDAVVLAVPPAKAISILGSNSLLFPVVPEIMMLPCWVVMVVFDSPLDLPFDAAFVHGSSLSFMARDSSKPQRKGKECWILHGSPDWTLGHFDLDLKLVSNKLISSLFEETGLTKQTPTGFQAYRWRYALAANPLSTGCLWDQGTRLGICGDWCHGSRVEGAFLSGNALAAKIQNSA